MAVPCVGLALLCQLAAQGRVGFCELKSLVPWSVKARCANCESERYRRIEEGSVLAL